VFPIQSNLYCKNTADRTQLTERMAGRIKILETRKSQVMRMMGWKSVGVFVQQSNNKVFSS